MILIAILMLVVSGVALFLMGTAEYQLQKEKLKINEIEVIELKTWKQLK